MTPAAPSRRAFVILMLLGLCLRVAALSLPGTGDVMVFKIWAHAGATGRVAEMYGVGHTPPERRLHDYDGRQATVDYPPIALYGLALAGTVYNLLFPGFPNTAALTAAVKLLPVAAELGLVWLLVISVRRLSPGRPGPAWWAGLAFWLNPAVLLASAPLGYLDAIVALPAVGALVAAASGHAVLAGVLAGIAMLTKPQALLILPVAGLALLNWRAPGGTSRARRAPLLAAGAAAATAGAVLAPVVAAGAWPNFVQAMGSLGRHDMLSGQAANLWWIVTWAMRAVYAVPDLGVIGAFLTPVRRPLAISRIVELGYPNPRLWASAAVAGAIAWGLWKGRAVRDLPRLALLGAWVVYAYFMLAVQVHENHFFLVIPLLAITAAHLPQWRKPFWLLSAIFALNLFLFYGIGGNAGFAPPRNITGLDATVWLSALDAAVFVWFGRRLGRCLSEPQAVPTAGPSGSLHPRQSSSR